jgi:hypothetical protein
MEDIEKSRAEYVTHLEQQVKHLQEQVAKFKPLAEMWTPVLNGHISDTGSARFTLQFGGKRVTGEISAAGLTQMSPADATASVVDTLIESLVVDRLREVVRPEVERIQRGLASIRQSSL